jgi:peroxiredoxin family protein
MAMDIMKVTHDDFDAEIGPATGLTRFLSDAEGGQMLTF